MELKTPLVAYYMVPKNGGFELRKLTIEEDVVLSDEAVDDPDAWEQTISTLENVLGKQFE